MSILWPTNLKMLCWCEWWLKFLIRPVWRKISTWRNFLLFRNISKKTSSSEICDDHPIWNCLVYIMMICHFAIVEIANSWFVLQVFWPAPLRPAASDVFLPGNSPRPLCLCLCLCLGLSIYTVLARGEPINYEIGLDIFANLVEDEMKMAKEGR